MSKSSKGITLVALAVTIVVLLILAGVTLSAVVGDNGIIQRAQETKDNTEQKTTSSTDGTNRLEFQLAQEGRASARPEDVLKGKTFYTSLDEPLQTGILEPIDVSDATATEDQVLEGATFYAGDENKKTGTLKLANVTPGTATSSEILEGKTAWVNGVQVTGTLKNNGQYQYGGMGEGTDYFAINSLPEGAYYSNGQTWAPEARISKTTLYNYLGGNYNTTLSKNQYFYTHTNGITYLVSWIPKGVYNGWQTASDGTSCAEVWTPKEEIDKLVGGNLQECKIGWFDFGQENGSTHNYTRYQDYDIPSEVQSARSVKYYVGDLGSYNASHGDSDGHWLRISIEVINNNTQVRVNCNDEQRGTANGPAHSIYGNVYAIYIK